MALEAPVNVHKPEEPLNLLDVLRDGDQRPQGGAGQLGEVQVSRARTWTVMLCTVYSVQCTVVSGDGESADLRGAAPAAAPGPAWPRSPPRISGPRPPASRSAWTRTSSILYI